MRNAVVGVFNASQDLYLEGNPKVWDGSTWKQVWPYIWTGSAWKAVGGAHTLMIPFITSDGEYFYTSDGKMFLVRAHE